MPRGNYLQNGTQLGERFQMGVMNDDWAQHIVEQPTNCLYELFERMRHVGVLLSR